MQTPELISQIPSDARDAVNTAIAKLVVAAGELGMTLQELQTMIELGMPPVDVVDYLDAKLRRRIQ